MKKKEFRGYIDGHYVSGTFTEKNDQDVEKEEQEFDEAMSVLGNGIKTVGKVVLGGLALLAIGAALSDENNK